jgi:hypothetical protein
MRLQDNPVPAAVKYVPAATPQCPAQNGVQPLNIPNPDDCNAYYDCSNGDAVPMHCPPDLYFCPEKQTCDWWWDSECTYDCNSTEVTTEGTTERPTKGPTFGPTEGPTFGPTYGPTEGPTEGPTYAPTEGPTFAPTEGPTYGPTEAPTYGPTDGTTAETICHPEDEGVYVPNPADCNAYYECFNGETIPITCPDGLYFCPQKNTCAGWWDTECTYDCAIVSK